MSDSEDKDSGEAEARPVRAYDRARPRTEIEMAPAEDGKRPIVFQSTDEVTDADSATGQRVRVRRAKVGPPWILISSLLVAAIWVAGAGLVFAREHGATGTDLQALFALTVQVLGPAAFAVLAGFMGEGIARSNREAMRLAAAARRMMEPDRTGEGAVRLAGRAVESEIRRLEGALETVSTRIGDLESRVGERARQLSDAGTAARDGAGALVRTMEDERARLDALVRALTDLTSTASRSTQAAAAGLDDHATHLTAATERMTRRSAEAADAALEAADRLDAAAARASGAVAQLDQAAQRGEAALARAHDMMVMARIRADEAITSLAGVVETLRANADAANAAAAASASQIGASTQAIRDQSLMALDEIQVIAEQAGRQIVAALQAESAAAARVGQETIEALTASAASVRGSVLETQDLVSLAIDTNQRKLDSLRQATFDTARDADAFTDARIRDARALVERSAAMLDETGARVAERFQVVAAGAADQARVVEDILDGLSRKIAALPDEAGARAAALEQLLAQTLSRINDSGRKAADEAASLDEAFQNRLRESYTAMGELVMRLGGVAGLAGVSLPATAPPDQSPPAAPRTVTAPSRARSEPPPRPAVQGRTDSAPVPQPPAAEPPAPAASAAPEQPPPAPPPPPPQPAPEPLASAPTGLRGRIEEAAAPEKPADAAPAPSAPTPDTPPVTETTNPSPGAQDPYAGIAFSRPEGAQPMAGTSWRWRDVLSSIDSGADAGSSPEAQTPARNEPTSVLGLLARDLGLETALPDSLGDRLRALAVRGRERAKVEVLGLAPDVIRALRNRLRRDADLRPRLVRFVESRREQAARGRLGLEELRLYLVADACLDE